MRNQWSVLAVVMGLALGLVPVWAEDVPAGGGGDEVLYDGDAGGALEPAAQDAVIDVLEDGAVEGDPAAAGGSEERAKRFKDVIAKFDKDADGKLSAEEKTAARQNLRETRDEFMKKRMTKEADANGDGTIDETEQKTLDDLMAKQKAKATETREKVVKKFDANGDGTIDQTERGQLREAFKKRMQKAFRERGGKGREGRDGRPGRKGEHPKGGSDEPAEEGGEGEGS